jgi:hypothetical protein
VGEPPPAQEIQYIDEAADLASAMVHISKRKMTLKEYFRGLKRSKIYRYYNKHDKKVFFGLFVKAVSLNFKK